MRFEGLDLNLLVALDVLLQEGQISRAADRLHLSQSAMSSALGRLRDYFQDELFVPVGRRMMATPRAESLAGPVREVLMQVRATITRNPAFHPPESSRRFTLSLSDYLAVVLLPAVVALLEREAPGVTLEVSPTTADSHERMELGHLDLLIGPERYLMDGHRRCLVLRDRHVCVTCRDHPDVGEAMTEAQFFALGHVTSVFGPARAPAMAWQALAAHGRTPRAEVLVPGFSTVPFLLPGTLRVAILQERMARRFAQMLPLKVLESPVALPEMTQLAQWRALYDEEPGHRWLRGRVLAAAASLDG